MANKKSKKAAPKAAEKKAIEHEQQATSAVARSTSKDNTGFGNALRPVGSGEMDLEFATREALEVGTQTIDITDLADLKSALEHADRSVRPSVAVDGKGVRQGDVLLFFHEDVKKFPEKDLLAAANEEFQLAPGNSVGSRHCVKLPEGCVAVAPKEERIKDTRLIAGPVLYIKAGTTLDVTHPEHAHHSIKFPKDCRVEVGFQPDYATSELRRVHD